MILSVVAIIISYLIGSISFSVLIAKWLKGIDIRDHGSGNAGATNTLRVLGKGPAIFVLLLDALKGVAAIWLGVWFSIGLSGHTMYWVPALCGIAAILGHNWPIYFRFRGGKGIATTIGVLATLCIVPTLIAGVFAIASIVITRYVSLGSLIFVTLTPIVLLIQGYSAPIVTVSVIIWLLAVWRHQTNIVKIFKGTENKIGSKADKGGNKVV
ncbi:glycerol-3-phosphate 1-O-acyltransferase PlsY [Paenibacillus sp. PK4536]|uniref:glycerol-3-phosphate 1-O-acyltransferase PlsY n=1 Tax=Paenibacillus TaxID=44249 RepID=UPI0010C026A0|nr:MULTISPECIES: glycerol-3-phosphate 1-O-acyltransferase PlsY [Paenibacillus]TKJ94032.1 acyl-phosphate glycerol 3-phosphate acyltransferase [Paenibacillus sp. CFBP13512]WIM38796.1 glycerol-3-phosphate 1-O-acyltransferase PlsY [Paenibacillus sp. PK4536]CAJ1314525.1 glycerol-3-phosphate 1-O-acyltransferase PlsY [Paenibacillus nuruki]